MSHVQVGQVVRRVEDRALLTGGGTYVANLVPADALHVAFVRSTEAHAVITSIDTAAARTQSGVVRVVTFDDLTGVEPIPPYPVVPDAAFGHPLLAPGRVRFVGEPVVAVVATSVVAAADAAELVEVSYEPLPAAVTPTEALADGVLLFEPAGTNVACAVPAGEAIDFGGCEVVVSADIVNSRMYSSPIEGRVALAEWIDGRLVCHTATQGVHMAHDRIAAALRMAEDEIRCITPDVGGAFGAKATPGPEECVVAWLARDLHRAVFWAETRTESLLALGHCRAQHQTITVGGTRAGDITHYRLHVVADLGAYPDVNALLPVFTRLMAQGVYRIPNVEYSSRGVVTNTTPVGSFRGAGRPEATAAIERAVDLFAAEIGLDPVAVRRRNLIGAGEFPFTAFSGAVYDCGDYAAALDLALAAVGYDTVRAEQAGATGGGRSAPSRYRRVHLRRGDGPRRRWSRRTRIWGVDLPRRWGRRCARRFDRGRPGSSHDMGVDRRGPSRRSTRTRAGYRR